MSNRNRPIEHRIIYDVETSRQNGNTQIETRKSFIMLKFQERIGMDLEIKPRKSFTII